MRDISYFSIPNTVKTISTIFSTRKIINSITVMCKFANTSNEFYNKMNSDNSGTDHMWN